MVSKWHESQPPLQSQAHSMIVVNLWFAFIKSLDKAVFHYFGLTFSSFFKLILEEC